jgi:uncharacterized tellurite resistance protein B-like protein
MLHEFDSTDKKRIKSHLKSIIHLALLDGHFDETEQIIVQKLAMKFGITKAELDQMIEEDENYDYNPPVDLEERFEFLFDFVMMMLADDHVSENELKLLKLLALNLNFNHQKIDNITAFLVEESKKNADPEYVFNGFKKVILGR